FPPGETPHSCVQQTGRAGSARRYRSHTGRRLIAAQVSGGDRRARRNPRGGASAYGLDDQSVWLAILAAMAAPVLFGEAFFLRFRTMDLRYLAFLLDDHVAAFGHAEGLLEQTEMIEFRVGRMLEGLEP